MKVFRETVKLIMFTVLWAVPFLAAKTFGSPWYLLLIFISMIMTFMLFGHYEDMEKISRASEIVEKKFDQALADKGIIFKDVTES